MVHFRNTWVSQILVPIRLFIFSFSLFLLSLIACSFFFNSSLYSFCICATSFSNSSLCFVRLSNSADSSSIAQSNSSWFSVAMLPQFDWASSYKYNKYKCMNNLNKCEEDIETSSIY